MPFASVILALAVGAVIITLSSVVITGLAATPTLLDRRLRRTLEGGLGIGSEDPLNALTRTITNSAPLLLAGLSVGVGFKAGLFNIGATGQFVIGGLAASIVGAAVAQRTPVLAIPIAVLAGVVGERLLRLHPGLPQGHHRCPRGRHHDHAQLHRGPHGHRAWSSTSSRSPDYTFDRTADVGTAALPVAVRSGSAPRASSFAYAFVPIFWWFVWKTTVGFEIRTVGANPSAARYAGMSPRRLIMLTMSLCGLLAGLAGVISFLGELGFYPATFGTQIGFDAIAIALLGRSHPVGVMLGGPVLRLHACGCAR